MVGGVRVKTTLKSGGFILSLRNVSPGGFILLTKTTLKMVFLSNAINDTYLSIQSSAIPVETKGMSAGIFSFSTII